MARKPKLIHTVKVGRRNYKLRTNKSFFTSVPEEAVKATGPQMRVLAYSSYTLLVDKILAGDARGIPTRFQVNQLPYYDKKTTRPQGRSPFKFQPLSEEYLERKAAAELDPRPLIATGFYLEHLQVTEEETRQGRLYSVYVPDIVHEPSGVDLQTLVGWLEYGTTGSNGMPPRPTWRPVAIAVRRKWDRLPKGIRAEALRQALKKMR